MMENQNNETVTVDGLLVRVARQRERAERWTEKYEGLVEEYEFLVANFDDAAAWIEQLRLEIKRLKVHAEEVGNLKELLKNALNSRNERAGERDRALDQVNRLRRQIEADYSATRLGKIELKKRREARVTKQCEKLVSEPYFDASGNPVEWLRRQLKFGFPSNLRVDITETGKRPEHFGEPGYHTTPSGKTIVNHPNAYGYRTVYHCSTERIEVGSRWVVRNIRKLAREYAERTMR